MRQWYVLYTKPRAENKVAAALNERSIETFLPETTDDSAEWPKKSVPFFPGYMFMRVDLKVENPAHWLWTPGVRYMIAYGDRPVPVPNEVIKLIRSKLGELEASRTRLAHGLRPGDIVKIKDGPFKDMLAVFDGPTTPAVRVQVLLSGLGHSVRLRIPHTALEKTRETDEIVAKKRPRRTRGRGRRIN